MKKNNVLLKISSIFLIIILAVGAYILLIRPWQLTWGSSEEEITRSMPGDEFLPIAEFNATRGITIKATPEEIWPWLVQIGDQRAGFYGYDWFDNRFIRSAEEILPEFQGLKVGDDVPISAVVTHTVWMMETNGSMVWIGGDEEIDGTWAWGLYRIDSEHTRLVTRIKAKYDWSDPLILFNFFVDGGDLPFMRKAMLGIKQRAEGNITDSFFEDTLEGGLWFGTLFLFIGAIVNIFKSKDWESSWLIALGAAATFQLIFYARPPIWIGICLEIGLLIGLIRLSKKQKI